MALTTAEKNAQALYQTVVYVSADSPVAVASGSTWLGPIIDLSDPRSLGFSLDMKLTHEASTPAVAVTLHGGNFLRTSGAFPQLDYTAGDLPDISAISAADVEVVYNVENVRVNFVQLEFAVTGGDISIAYAVSKVV